MGDEYLQNNAKYDPGKVRSESMDAAQELKSAADELGRQEALQRLECQVKQPEGDPGQSVKYEPVFDGKNCNAEKFEMKSGINQDDLIIQQHREIEKEISDNIALIGPKENINSLEKEYAKDDVYYLKVQDLSNKYKYIRRTRPDGNCFFRSFGFAYLESLLDNTEEFNSFRDLAKKSKEKLIALGFPQFTLEDFHDTFMEIVDVVGQGTSAHDELFRLFNDQSYSDYAIVYLRLITSGHLQEKQDFYQQFIEGDRTVADFCHQEVEPMFKESDHIHIIALCTALQVGVRVRYMDRGDSSHVIAHDFPEGSTPAIHLLYRPGHYDILYPDPACG